MSAALRAALAALAPPLVVIDARAGAAAREVLDWVGRRTDAAVTGDREAVVAGGLLVTADAARVPDAVALGAAVLLTAGAAEAADGWSADRVPEGLLLRPVAVAADRRLPDRAVSIVVPIHNAGAELRRCVDALARNTTWPAELVLIDDASTDPAVFEVLEEVARRPAVRILRNVANLGFTATVNRGLRATSGDVVVLNSDTEVGPRWLERLRDAAHRDPRTGSATAGSDNAGAFSLPVIGEPNAVPLHLGVDDAARLVAQAVGDELAPTPTANGFCMYLRRALLDDVGDLDEAGFPRGYGEENDLCLRAARRGWRHVVDPGTYVHHAREASFKAEKAALAAAARRVIDARHPQYTAAVREFVADPAMARARERVGTAFAAGASPLPRILYVIHEGGGGTPVGNFALMEALHGRVDTLLLTSDRRRVRLDRVHGGERVRLETWDLDRPIAVLDFTRHDYRAIAERVLREHAVDLVHVRHLFKHTFDVPRVAARLGVPVVFSFHDFYFTCPTVHLLDDTGAYCAARCTPGDGACHVPTGWEALPHLKHAYVHQWREEVTAMLAGADAFVTTSDHARAVHRDALPVTGQAPFEVIPHGRALAQAHGLNAVPEPGGPIRVLVLANLDKHKGADYLRAIRRHAGDRLELHFLGDAPSRYAHFGTFHGRYAPADLRDLVAAIRPSFVGLFSIVAETFSHALTEAWALGIPVVATDLGAFGERLREHGGGWLVPHDDAAAAAAQLLALADDPAAYRVQAFKADLRGVPTAAEMADGYAALYAETLARRRSLAAPATRPLRVTAIVGGEGGLYPGSTYVRVVQPLRHPVAARELTARIRYASDRSVPADAQAVLIQRTAIPPDQLIAVLDEVDDRGLPLVVDLDDNLLLRADDVNRQAIQALFESAALVTVSTPALADAVRARCRRVEVVPNAIDERLFLSGLTAPPAIEPPASGEPVRLAYVGSTTHAEDLELLRPALEELERRAPGRYRLELVGVLRPKHDPPDRFYDRLVVPDDLKPYPRFVPWLRGQRHRWQVGLAPLADTAFNRCKSDLKWLEYTALGLPVVASALEPYRSIEDGVTGRLVAGDPAAWADAIEAAVADGAALAVAAWETVVSGRLLRQRDARIYGGVVS